MTLYMKLKPRKTPLDFFKLLLNTPRSTVSKTIKRERGKKTQVRLDEHNESTTRGTQHNNE